MTKLILLFSFSFVASFVQAQQTTNNQGVIESPSAFVSGIGFISGWKCNSEDITLKMHCFYNHDLDPAQNMLRSDTREVCDGEIDNGWIIQVNWDDWVGCSQVDAFDNGQQFASRKFTVGEIGEGFIKDQEGRRIKVPGFPSPDQVTHFAWSTATQHFEGMYTADCGTGDTCPGSREGDDGNNGSDGGDSAWDPFRIIPEITIAEGVTAGTQPLPQWENQMDWPQNNGWCCEVSVSTIFEPGDWMFLRKTSKGPVLVPHDEIEIRARRAEIDEIAFKGPWVQHYGVSVFNLIGIGIEPLFVVSTERTIPGHYGNSYGAEFQTVSNAPKLFPYIPPDMTLPAEQTIYHKLKKDLGVGIPRLFLFLNSKTGEFGYRAGVGGIGGKGVPDEWYFPNNGRGPWRLVGTNNLTEGKAIVDIGQPILYFPPTQTVIDDTFGESIDIGFNTDRRFARDDIRGTGKLEIISMSTALYDYWVNPPDPSETLFTDNPVVYRSAATE